VVNTKKDGSVCTTPFYRTTLFHMHRFLPAVELPFFFDELFEARIYGPVFPKLCAAEEAEACRECFMFWQNLLYVTSLPLQSLWRV